MKIGKRGVLLLMYIFFAGAICFANGLKSSNYFEMVFGAGAIIFIILGYKVLSGRQRN
jgi:hypothetical protein